VLYALDAAVKRFFVVGFLYSNDLARDNRPGVHFGRYVMNRHARIWQSLCNGVADGVGATQDGHRPIHRGKALDARIGHREISSPQGQQSWMHIQQRNSAPGQKPLGKDKHPAGQNQEIGLVSSEEIEHLLLHAPAILIVPSPRRKDGVVGHAGGTRSIQCPCPRVMAHNNRDVSVQGSRGTGVEQRLQVASIPGGEDADSR